MTGEQEEDEEEQDPERYSVKWESSFKYCYIEYEALSSMFARLAKVLLPSIQRHLRYAAANSSDYSAVAHKEEDWPQEEQESYEKLMQSSIGIEETKKDTTIDSFDFHVSPTITLSSTCIHPPQDRTFWWLLVNTYIHLDRMRCYVTR